VRESVVPFTDSQRTASYYQLIAASLCHLSKL